MEIAGAQRLYMLKNGRDGLELAIESSASLAAVCTAFSPLIRVKSHIARRRSEIRLSSVQLLFRSNMRTEARLRLLAIYQSHERTGRFNFSCLTGNAGSAVSMYFRLVGMAVQASELIIGPLPHEPGCR